MLEEREILGWYNRRKGSSSTVARAAQASHTQIHVPRRCNDSKFRKADKDSAFPELPKIRQIPRRGRHRVL